jgi:hypothetical protein
MHRGELWFIQSEGLKVFKNLLSVGNVAESESYRDLEEQAYAGEGVGLESGEA